MILINPFPVRPLENNELITGTKRGNGSETHQVILLVWAEMDPNVPLYKILRANAQTYPRVLDCVMAVVVCNTMTGDTFPGSILWDTNLDFNC